jgi:Cu/Ag efflux protein CusF
MSKYLLRTVMAITLAAATVAFILPARAAEEEKTEKSKKKAWKGTIEAIDAAGGTVTVKKKVKSMTFKIGEDCKYVTKEKKSAELADFKVGDEVNVQYTEQDGSMVCHRVAHTGLRQKKAAGEVEKTEEHGEESAQ